MNSPTLTKMDGFYGVILFLFIDNLKKAKQIAFMVLLKRVHHSGWISFSERSTCGVSQRMYSRLFNELRELGLIRKGNNGYFLASFNKCMARILGEHGKYVRIEEKQGSFQSLVDSVLHGMAYNKIRQQLESTKHAILENKGRLRINSKLMQAYIREGVANCLISSRQIGKAIGVSAPKANSIINFLKKRKFIEISIPVYSNNIYSFNNKDRYWNSERNVFAINRINKDSIKTLVLCK